METLPGIACAERLSHDLLSRLSNVSPEPDVHSLPCLLSMSWIMPASVWRFSVFDCPVRHFS